MNFPQQPFPGQAPQGFPQPQPQKGFHPQQPTQGFPQPQPQGFPNVAGAAQQNTFAQMLNEPPRQRRNREKIADGTHVVQFNIETKMDTSQTTMQQYLLVSYVVMESSVPQMVHKQFSTPMMLNNRGSVQALAEMTKVIFGTAYAQQLAAQNAAPFQIAQLLEQHLVNKQTGQGLFALLNTWRGRKGKNGGPPPSYDEAFVNHDWMLSAPQQFSLAQAQAAGLRVNAPAPAAPTQQWAAVPTAPAQQGFVPPQAPQGFPAPQAPQGFPAPQAPQGFAPPQANPGFPPPQTPGGFPSQQAPPQSFIPQKNGPPF